MSNGDVSINQTTSNEADKQADAGPRPAEAAPSTGADSDMPFTAAETADTNACIISKDARTISAFVFANDAHFGTRTTRKPNLIGIANAIAYKLQSQGKLSAVISVKSYKVSTKLTRVQVKLADAHDLKCEIGSLRPIVANMSGFEFGVFFSVKRTDKTGDIVDELVRTIDLMLAKQMAMNCGIESEASRLDKDRFGDQLGFGFDIDPKLIGKALWDLGTRNNPFKHLKPVMGPDGPSGFQVVDGLIVLGIARRC